MPQYRPLTTQRLGIKPAQPPTFCRAKQRFLGIGQRTWLPREGGRVREALDRIGTGYAISADGTATSARSIDRNARHTVSAGCHRSSPRHRRARCMHASWPPSTSALQLSVTAKEGRTEVSGGSLGFTGKEMVGISRAPRLTTTPSRNSTPAAKRHPAQLPGKRACAHSTSTTTMTDDAPRVIRRRRGPFKRSRTGCESRAQQR